MYRSDLWRDVIHLQESVKILIAKSYIIHVNSFLSKIRSQGPVLHCFVQFLRIIAKDMTAKLFQKICQLLLICAVLFLIDKNF